MPGCFDNFKLFGAINGEGRGSNEVLVKLLVNSCPSRIRSRLLSCQAPFQVKSMNNWAEGLGDAGPP